MLRPIGLKAGPATAHSGTLRWSRPPTGPLPDRYLIWRNGLPAGSAAGTATSYQQAGLDPGVTYQYRLVAVRGGKRSPASALLTLTTSTPPISQARLQGLWNINARNVRAQNIHTGYNGYHGSLTWTFRPVCRTGPCAVILHGKIDGIHSITMKLSRAGAVYQGRITDVAIPCGPGANSISDPMTLRVRIRVTAAAAQDQVWAAISWAGTIAGTTQYLSAATFYCPAGNFTAVLNSPD
ncbi:MAG: fibronectin type III domain-containing protein [Gemmatimonadota bacterium]